MRLVPNESIQIHLFGADVPEDLIDNRYYYSDIRISGDIFQIKLSTDIFIRPSQSNWSGRNIDRLIVFAFDSERSPREITGCQVEIVVSPDTASDVSPIFEKYRKRFRAFYEIKNNIL